MTTHVMLDLETLDTNRDAIIISIGMVKFNLCNYELGEELYIELGLPALKHQLAKGRTLSIDNFSWWAQQSDRARAVWAPSANKSDIGRCFQLLYDYFIDDEKVTIWGNGATFDNVCLRSFYESFSKKYPGHYSRDLCYRTMKVLFGHRAKLERVGVHHNALSDAVTQANHLMAMHKAMHGSK